jgi:radical SAM superfamily enzyme YgiQ (UPF0313 family)
VIAKANVLLLNPPFSVPIIRDNYCCFTSKSGYLWAPADLLYLSGILDDPRIKLFVKDAVATGVGWEDISALIKKEKIDVIICLTGTVSFHQDMENLEKAKKKGIRTYVMGNTPSFETKRFMSEYKFLDGVIHNYFDNKIIDLVLRNMKVASVTKRYKDGKIRYGQVNYMKGGAIDLVKPPQYSLFPLDKYITPISQRHPVTTSIFGYGCPFKCSFCIGSMTNFLPRTIKSIKMELDAMKKAGVKEIFFQDSTFNAQPKYLDKILELMIIGNYSFTWSANVHSFHLTEKTLLKMKHAGCHNLQIGVESGSQKTLNKHAPSKRKEKISKLFVDCKKVGIKTLGYFVIGLPGEKEKDVEKTIDFAIKLDPDFASFSVVTPDYGTKLYREAVENLYFYDDSNLRSFDSSGGAVLDLPEFSKKQQNHMTRLAYRKFYLRPSKIFGYITDFQGLKNYIKNAWFLLLKKIL